MNLKHSCWIVLSTALTPCEDYISLSSLWWFSSFFFAYVAFSSHCPYILMCHKLRAKWCMFVARLLLLLKFSTLQVAQVSCCLIQALNLIYALKLFSCQGFSSQEGCKIKSIVVFSVWRELLIYYLWWSTAMLSMNSLMRITMNPVFLESF